MLDGSEHLVKVGVKVTHADSGAAFGVGVYTAGGGDTGYGLLPDGRPGGTSVGRCVARHRATCDRDRAAPPPRFTPAMSFPTGKDTRDAGLESCVAPAG